MNDRYVVWLTRTVFGSVELEAANASEAEELALGLGLEEVDWEEHHRVDPASVWQDGKQVDGDEDIPYWEEPLGEIPF